MGFGFNLFFVFLLLPATAILLIVWALTKRQVFGKTLGIIWIGVICLVILSLVMERLRSKVVLEKKDFYGSYSIDKSFFPGRQTEWQYDHFRFDIETNDSIYFHVTDQQRVVKTYKGTISTVKPYGSERLVITMTQPSHHVLSSNPTVYRDTDGFYLVFNSPLYNNMFFVKTTDND
jgi:hypothetical protein